MVELLVLKRGELPCGDLQEGVVMAFTYTEDPRKEEEAEEIIPECIICGSRKCEYFYFDKWSEPLGCDGCIQSVEVYETEERVCPVCGSVKCDYFYKKHGEIIGCDGCIRREEVW